MDYDAKVEGVALIIQPKMEKLDFTVCGKFKSEMSGLMHEGGHKYLVLNLADVAFIDSMSIGALVSLRKTLAESGAKMGLCNLHPFVRKVLTVVTVNAIFDVFDNEQSALQTVGKA